MQNSGKVIYGSSLYHINCSLDQERDIKRLLNKTSINKTCNSCRTVKSANELSSIEIHNCYIQSNQFQCDICLKNQFKSHTAISDSTLMKGLKELLLCKLCSEANGCHCHQSFLQFTECPQYVACFRKYLQETSERKLNKGCSLKRTNNDSVRNLSFTKDSLRFKEDIDSAHCLVNLNNTENHLLKHELLIRSKIQNLSLYEALLLRSQNHDISQYDPIRRQINDSKQDESLFKKKINDSTQDESLFRQKINDFTQNESLFSQELNYSKKYRSSLRHKINYCKQNDLIISNKRNHSTLIKSLLEHQHNNATSNKSLLRHQINDSTQNKSFRYQINDNTRNNMLLGHRINGSTQNESLTSGGINYSQQNNLLLSHRVNYMNRYKTVLNSRINDLSPNELLLKNGTNKFLQNKSRQCESKYFIECNDFSNIDVIKEMAMKTLNDLTTKMNRNHQKFIRKLLKNTTIVKICSCGIARKASELSSKEIDNHYVLEKPYKCHLCLTKKAKTISQNDEYKYLTTLKYKIHEKCFKDKSIFSEYNLSYSKCDLNEVNSSKFHCNVKERRDRGAVSENYADGLTDMKSYYRRRKEIEQYRDN